MSISIKQKWKVIYSIKIDYLLSIGWYNVVGGNLPQINTNNEARLLTVGDRFKLKSNVEHTEYAGIEGVSFLSARPSN